jgi:predicted nucleotidyltransferase
MLDLDRDLPRAEIAKLCQLYHVRELAVFGSALRDDFSESSDLDFLVEFDPSFAIGMEFIDLRLALEDLLGRSVDLVPKRGLQLRLRNEIPSSARILYAA